MEFTQEELEYIEDNPERCEACGHLEIFHNYHCCTFCKVDGCKCEWDELPEEDKE